MDPSSYKNLVDAASSNPTTTTTTSSSTVSRVKTEDGTPKETAAEKTTPTDDDDGDETPKIPSHVPRSLLPLTEPELDLLRLYETVRSYEKTAERTRSDRAVKALEDAAKKHEEKRRAAETGSSAADGGGGDAGAEGRDDGPDDDGDRPSAAAGTGGRKKKKPKRPRSSDAAAAFSSGDESMASASDAGGHESDDGSGGPVDAEERREREKEDLFRRLEGGSSEDELDVVKKAPKRARTTSVADGYDSGETPSTPPPQESLIQGLEEQMSTPPTDLSRKLKMTGLSGRNLFPSKGNVERKEMSWFPPEDARDPEDGCMELKLDKFDAARVAVGQGRNTLAIKFMAPTESRRFSINIASPDHANYHSVLFHFNPRQFEKGGNLVINNKQEGMWGQALNIPLSSVPLVFGQTSSTLVVQITGDGFDMFLEGRHCARLEHRNPLPQKAKYLTLQMPSTDDRGKRENWTVYKVWWGHKEPMAKDISNVAGVNTHHQLHSKKLFVSKLTKIHSEPEVDLRRAELERAFRKYGGAHGITATVPMNSTFAFVEVETERDADLALKEMAGRYRLNRARRSKHEALMEKRALAEQAQAGSGGVGGAAAGKNEWG